jgi:hypothetical protein
MLVAYGREKFGDDFWAKTAVQAAAFRGLFYPLQTAIKMQAFPLIHPYQGPGFFRNNCLRMLIPVHLQYMEKIIRISYLTSCFLNLQTAVTWYSSTAVTVYLLNL